MSAVPARGELSVGGGGAGGESQRGHRGRGAQTGWLSARRSQPRVPQGRGDREPQREEIRRVVAWSIGARGLGGVCGGRVLPFQRGWRARGAQLSFSGTGRGTAARSTWAGSTERAAVLPPGKRDCAGDSSRLPSGSGRPPVRPIWYDGRVWPGSGLNGVPCRVRRAAQRDRGGSA